MQHFFSKKPQVLFFVSLLQQASQLKLYQFVFINYYSGDTRSVFLHQPGSASQCFCKTIAASAAGQAHLIVFV
jgi:hypothetical protein